MSPFRRGKAPPSPASRPQDGWAETRVEPGAPDAGWAATRVDGPPGPDGWADTRAQTVVTTRFLGENDDAPASNAQDVGRPVGADTRELFVSCDPADALQQQFDHLQPEFIAVHDIAAAASRKLLASVAAAGGTRVQKLLIRRQGYGTALATLEFVDVPAGHGKSLRLYSTEADTDPAGRAALARTLLGFSRLAVVMVGDLPAAALAAEMQPLGDAMTGAGWRNRQMLLLPLASAGIVASQGISLGQASSVAVRTTPQVARPADAWTFINASWSRFGEPLPSVSPPVATPAAMRPMPAIRATSPRASEPSPDAFERYLREIGHIAGLIGCCVFDVATGRVAAHAGTGPEAKQLALHGGQLLTAMGVASRSLGFGRLLPDAAITLGAHHLLLRGLPRHPGLAVHVVLDKHVANLTLARLQLQRMDAVFETTPG